jgi:hypothetical protein
VSGVTIMAKFMLIHNPGCFLERDYQLLGHDVALSTVDDEQCRLELVAECTTRWSVPRAQATCSPETFEQIIMWK